MGDEHERSGEASTGTGGGTDPEAEADTEMGTERTVVAALLTGAGLDPPPEEVDRLAALYPGLRRSIDRFHAVDAGDGVAAAVFRADPTAGEGAAS